MRYDVDGENMGPQPAHFMSKPYSMNNLADQTESQQPSSRRVSSRRKKEVSETDLTDDNID
jgi:hypothetical protein